MLTIINNLEPFFQDNYRRINVREYARIKKISPPFASKTLESYKKESLLLKEQDRNYNFYLANKDSKEFIELSRIYWYTQFMKLGLLDYLKKELISPIVILFGSFSKTEIKEGSDIDIAIFTISKKELKLEKFEKTLKRKIQIFIFKDIEKVKNKELLKNILNGFILEGGF